MLLAGSLAEGSNQVSLSENGSAYYTFMPSTSARYTFAPVGGMEIYSKIDADDETMYDLKKLSVSDGEAVLESGNTYYICLDGGVEDKWGRYADQLEHECDKGRNFVKFKDQFMEAER